MGNLAPGNVRLTKDMREQIAAKVINYKFGSTMLSELRHEQASIAQAVYNDMLSEKEKVLIESLPNGWLPESEYVSVRFGGEYTQLWFNGTITSLPYNMTRILGINSGLKTVTKRIPSYATRHAAKTFNARHALSERYSGLGIKLSKFKEDYTTSNTMLSATLKKATTSNRLIELWPEIKPFVEAVVGKPAASSTALAIPIASLNERFGLPVPE